MEVIYQDEKNHYKEAAGEAAQAVDSPQDLQRMKKAIREISQPAGLYAQRNVPRTADQPRNQKLSQIITISGFWCQAQPRLGTRNRNGHKPHYQPIA